MHVKHIAAFGAAAALVLAAAPAFAAETAEGQPPQQQDHGGGWFSDFVGGMFGGGDRNEASTTAPGMGEREYASTTPDRGERANGTWHMSGIAGTVSTVSGTTLTITRQMPEKSSATAQAAVYIVDASNATITKAGNASTVSAIAVGDTVMVQGTVNGTNVVATVIRDGVGPMMNRGGQEQPENKNPIIQGNGQPIVGGTVTAISGSALTITNASNITYSVDATNATIMKGHATSTLSSVATGDNVIVQGVVNGSAITASSIIDSGTATNATAETPAKAGVFGFFRGIGGFFAHLFGF